MERDGNIVRKYWANASWKQAGQTPDPVAVCLMFMPNSSSLPTFQIATPPRSHPLPPTSLSSSWFHSLYAALLSTYATVLSSPISWGLQFHNFTMASWGFLPPRGLHTGAPLPCTAWSQLQLSETGEEESQHSCILHPTSTMCIYCPSWLPAWDGVWPL